MKTLGFAGTAKNTGKTTTALHMLGLVTAAGIDTALTSIGYDGENKDHVTGLPKPRYFAVSGTTIATAARCLEIGTAQFEQVRLTGLNTILGEIVIARVRAAGTVVLAGPNRRMDLKALLEQLDGLGVGLTMVDGALNRLAALALADGLVLSTGAAFDERIDTLTDHAAAVESLFHIPAYRRRVTGGQRQARYAGTDGGAGQLRSGSVMDAAEMRQVLGWLAPGVEGDCFIPGVFEPGLFRLMLESGGQRLAGKRFIFSSPLNLLAAGAPQVWKESIDRMAGLGAEVACIKAMPLHFVTVNPFYPKFLQKTGSYLPEFVDKFELLGAARAKIKNTPVVDILQPPHPDLLALCGLKPESGGDHES